MRAEVSERPSAGNKRRIRLTREDPLECRDRLLHLELLLGLLLVGSRLEELGVARLELLVRLRLELPVCTRM